MKAIFVAGTDTGVGKTIVTGLLARHLLTKGYRVVTQKWVETGSLRSSRDIGVHLKLMGKRRADYVRHLSAMMPYIFKFASSPHLAARLENRHIRKERIKRSLKELAKHFDIVIIEGCGGLLVSLDKKTLMIDIVKELRLPVLLVAANRLGAINSTLLSLEALRSRKIKITGVIFNNVSKDENKRILKDNPRIVKALSGVSVLGTLPYTKDKDFSALNFTGPVAPSPFSLKGCVPYSCT